MSNKFLKGGDRVSNEKDVFNFHLNESLYFETGQEVQQMLSISLNPDISIQSYDDYVSIRGVMELTGEYEKDPLIKNNEAKNIEFTSDSRRYIEKIEATADDYAVFSHRFPVEISIPSYRVNSIDDITVDVALFDYELPDQNHLKLTSTVTIYGIQDKVQLREGMWATNNKVEDELETKNDSPESEPTDQFEFELASEDLEANKESAEASESFEEKKMTKSDDSDRWNFKKTESLESFMNSKKDHVNENEEETEKETIEKLEENTIEQTEHEEGYTEEQLTEVKNSDDGLKEETVDEEIITETELDGEVLAIKTEAVENVDESETTEDNTNYLTSLFRDEEALEENNYTQMRLCIVQDHDTLETIAERYEVSKLQLLKLNRLSDDHILSGQLLSIPKQKT